VNTTLKEGTKIKANKFHDLMGHINNGDMRLTAKRLGVIVTGKLDKCESCAIGKEKQKSVPKEDHKEFSAPGELIYMDLTAMLTVDAQSRVL
jgi:hypothetical protein